MKELFLAAMEVPAGQRASYLDTACAGDTAVLPNAPVLAYGRTWRRGGIVCRSRRTGLRCTNRSGHGFTLAREAWRIF